MQRTPEAQDRLTNGTVYACEQAFKLWREQFGMLMPADPDQLRIAFNSGYMAAMNGVLRATEPSAWRLLIHKLTGK
jgi:hypothetical protein